MIIKDWEGRDIQGECSGGGVFSAFNWRDLVLAIGGPNGRAIERKAARSSRGLSAYDPAIHAALKARDGRYCSLQSINSEDTVTWSIFGVYLIDFWIEDLLNLTF